MRPLPFFRRFLARAATAMLAVSFIFPAVSAAAGTEDEAEIGGSSDAALEESPQQAAQEPSGPRTVFKDRISPRWYAEGTRFWYRNDLRDGAKEFIGVDAERGVRQPAFDHAKLALSLSKTAGADYDPAKLPFDRIDFADDGKSVRFNAQDAAWRCTLDSYECTKTGPAEDLPAEDSEPNRDRR